MKHFPIFLLLAVTTVQAEQTVVSHDEDYYTADVRNTQLIYTQKNLPFAREAAKVEMLLQPAYEKAFGYVMDEPLYVGLISDRNQIANGFSTQYPNNRQINFIGGALMPDYFSAASWLNTLLYHETCHNYQTNAKDNVISQTLHTVLQNGSFILPWFTVPNIVESSFMLEGSAVLNESWHGNGGRLYSGRFKAATLMQAKAGYLTPERVYNDNYYFLYGSHFYTLGGFYNYYLAENYGLEKTNSYWKNHSHYWFWPFFTNNAMTDSVGADFETTFDGWRKKMEAEAQQVTETNGERIAGTQFIEPLNADAEKIYVVVNESGREEPELIIYDKATGNVVRDREPWFAGKAVQTPDGRYTTQSSAHVNPWRIYIGLYDDHGFLVDGTRGKVVEGYLSDGREVAFDVASSFERPQLYIGGKFYARTDSSVFVRGNDVYYCRQNGKTRTWYRNKTPLFTTRGYYGHIIGADDSGRTYFIANTPHGSGLFCYANGTFERMHPADTVIDARLIDENSAVVTAMGADEASIEKITFAPTEQAPYEVTLFVEKEPYYRAADPTAHEPENVPKVDLNNSYHSFLDMHYSATNIMLGSDEKAGFIFNVSVNFADPLTQNSLNFFVSRNLDEYTLGGGGYSNDQYFLHYSVFGYGVLDRPEDNASDPDDDSRDFGVTVMTSIPFVQTGYWYAAVNGSYYQDYDADSREPLSGELLVDYTQRFGVSLYPNFKLAASAYGASDRGDFAYGGTGTWKQGLPYEFYIGLGGQYSHSDADSPVDDHGIKMTKFQLAALADGDPTTVVMPSMRDSSAYVKSVFKGSAEFKKVFNAAKYFFTFPVSLRREAFYVNYNRYEIEDFALETTGVNEAVAGLLFDTYWMNRLPIPVSVEYLYNDTDGIADEHTFRFGFGLTF